MPLPIQNFGHILADLVDVVLVSDQLVVHLLGEVRTAVAQLWQIQQRILEQMEAVDLVLHAHIKRRGDGAFLLVADSGCGWCARRSAHAPAWDSRGTRR